MNNLDAEIQNADWPKRVDDRLSALDTGTTKILKLVAASVRLAGWLRLQEGNAEAERGRATGDHVSDLPSVPVEDVDAVGGQRGDAGREEPLARAAVARAAELLQRLLDDPQLAGALGEDELERVKVAERYLVQGMAANEAVAKAVTAAKNLPVSVKALIRDGKRRLLLLKDAETPYWDLPGGHVADGESLLEALRRVVKEEADLEVTKATQRDVRVMRLGNEVKPVVFFEASAIGQVRCGEEHLGHLWCEDGGLGKLDLGAFKAVLVPTATDMRDGTTGVERPASHRGGDGTQFYQAEDGEVAKVGAQSEVVNPRLREAKKAAGGGSSKFVWEAGDLEVVKGRQGPADRPILLLARIRALTE
mgnify:CR=1 FL=1